MRSNPIFVALDTPDLERALALSRAVRSHVGGLKVGLEFITACGPDGVKRIVDIGLPVFADVKFHDIPNTVAAASRELARLGAKMFNIHASGGEVMMREAAVAAHAIDPNVKVLGVTVLTSIDDSLLSAVGQRGPAAEQVLRLGPRPRTEDRSPLLPASAGSVDSITLTTIQPPKIRKPGVSRAASPFRFSPITSHSEPIGS